MQKRNVKDGLKQIPREKKSRDKDKETVNAKGRKNVARNDKA